MEKKDPFIAAIVLTILTVFAVVASGTLGVAIFQKYNSHEQPQIEQTEQITIIARSGYIIVYEYDGNKYMVSSAGGIIQIQD